MVVTTEAIVLKSQKFKESSRLLTVYSEEFGRLNMVAHGARRAKNKFGSAVEPLSCSTLTIYKSANKDLHTLSNAEISLPLRRIAESYDLLTTGLTLLEIVYNTQLHEETNRDLYRLLKQSLIALNAATIHENTLLALFQYRLATLLGFGFTPYHCPASGRVVTPAESDDFLLSFAEGAPFASGHSQEQAGVRIDAVTLTALQSLDTMTFEQSADIRLTPLQQTQLEDVFIRYFRFHLEKHIFYRTEKFRRDAQAP